MPNFEDYISKQSKQEKQLFATEESKRGYSDAQYDYSYSADQLEQQLEERTQISTLEDRTEYYFGNAQMLEAKVTRYRNLSQDDRQTEVYSGKYGNKKAKVRRKAAREASDFFEMAKREMTEVSEIGMNNFDIFQHRAKIMEYRLKARHKAAESKSRSKEQERYLKNKATLSCFMILKEQLENLMVQTNDKKQLAKFYKKQIELEKMMEAARENIQASEKSAARIWQEANYAGGGLFDRDFRNGKYQEYKAQNPDVSEDAVRTLITLEHMDTYRKENRLQWPQSVVMKTSYGTHVTRGEDEKDQINHEYETTEDEKRKEAIKLAALRKVERFPLPSPEEVKSKNFLKKFTANMSDYYDVLQIAVPHLLTAEEDSYEGKYIKAHPEFKEKLQALFTCSNYVLYHLRHHGIGQVAETGSGYVFGLVKGVPKEEKKDDKKDGEEKAEGKKIRLIDRVELKKEEVEALELSYSDAYHHMKAIGENLIKIKGEDDEFNQDDFERYQQIQMNVSVFNTERHMKKAYRALKVKLKRENEKADPKDVAEQYLRAVSVLLDNVGFVNKKATRTANNECLNTLEKGSEKDIQKLIKSKVSGIFDGIKLPTREEIQGGWFEKMMNERPEDLLTVLRKAECIDDMFEMFPYAKEIFEKNKLFMEKKAAFVELGQQFRDHMKKYHGIDPGKGAFDLKTEKEIPEEKKKELGMDDTKSSIRSEMLERITAEKAPAQKKHDPKRIGRKRRRMMKKGLTETEGQKAKRLAREAKERADEYNEMLLIKKMTPEQIKAEFERREEAKKKEEEEKKKTPEQKQKEEEERKKKEEEEKEALKKKEEEEKKQKEEEERKKKEEEEKKQKEEEEKKKKEEEEKAKKEKEDKEKKDKEDREKKIAGLEVRQSEFGSSLKILDEGNGTETWFYTDIDGKEHVLTARKPEDFREAIELRKKLLNEISYEKLDDLTQPLYDFYNSFVTDFFKDNDINQYIDPELLEKKNVSGMDLEQVAALRNKFLEAGYLRSDLSGKALEIYDYYSDAIATLRKADKTLNAQVKQHKSRGTKKYKVMPSTNLKKEYEMQAPESNDCWSCAGVGIFNHFIRKAKDYKALKQTQKDFREVPMAFIDQEQSNLDHESYLKRMHDIEAFTTQNYDQDRKHSPMGDPYVTADFYIRELRKIPGYENSAVRKSVFNFVAADSYVRGVKDDEQKIRKDTNASHNLREKLKETIAGALSKDSAIAMLMGMHYVTIIGIDGDTLHIKDSNNGTRTKMSISDVTDVDVYARPVELVWLEKIEDPKALADQFTTLDYDEETKTFSANEHMREVGSYEEEIAHTQGVGAWKTLEDKDSDVGSLISEAVYLPKTFTVKPKTKAGSKAGK